jgi:hypothetical protein
MIEHSQRPPRRIARAFLALAAALAATSRAPHALAAPAATPPAPPLGVWRGTSTCTDLKAAPHCHDEVVVYTFKPAEKAGAIHWQADKVVNGERLNMGELELAYDPDLACWKAEFHGPKGVTVWCLNLDGSHMTGSAWLLPGKETIRKIDALKE